MPNTKTPIQTKNAPAAIGAYSQAIHHGGLVHISGQIPLSPATGQIISDDPATQINQAFDNLLAVAEAAGGAADDFIKLTVYLTDLSNFPLVNEAMQQRFSEPYPARAAVEVSALPKGVGVEVEGILAPPAA